MAGAIGMDLGDLPTHAYRSSITAMRRNNHAVNWLPVALRSRSSGVQSQTRS